MVTTEKKIDRELQQLREHVQNLANTQIGDRYIFSGTKTTTAPYQEGVGYATGSDPEEPIDPAFDKTIEIEVFDGIMLQVNSTPIKLFNDIDRMFEDISKDIQAGTTGADLSKYITTIDTNMNELLNKRADIGARQNRVELMDQRLQTQEIIATSRMSENEDIDYEKAITDFITQESIHTAALSIGAKIIQPTLVDFL